MYCNVMAIMIYNIVMKVNVLNNINDMKMNIM